MSTPNLRLTLICAAAGTAIALSVSVPASALTLEAGIDIWHTGSGGASIDFGGIDPTTTTDDEAAIPAGFFGCGEGATTAHIEMQGVPIVTSNPTNAVGDGDTIVERLEDAVVSSGGSDTIDVKIVALSLENISGDTISRCGKSWTVKAFLSDTANQADGTMTVTDSTTIGGGTFTSTFTVKAHPLGDLHGRARTGIHQSLRL